MKYLWLVVVGVLVIPLAVAGVIYVSAFGAVDRGAEIERFSVGLSKNTAVIPEDLANTGYIKRAWALHIALRLKGVGNIAPGAYKISQAMSPWEIADVFARGPYMKWVVIPEGLRKEEIAELLADTLGWSDAELAGWISKDTAPDPDHTEGVYFPDTYLIPIDESPADVAKRLRTRFEEKFAPFAEEALRQNIRWPTVLKIASLVQREAGGKADMPIIAGVLWNRLLLDMKLDIDATLQYTKGSTENGWWPKAVPADKSFDSPYNTYLYKGLPPHPIANPGVDAISSVLFPAETKCVYYLHDSSGTIYCSETYEEHEQNIEQYL